MVLSWPPSTASSCSCGPILAYVRRTGEEVWGALILGFWPCWPVAASPCTGTPSLPAQALPAQALPALACCLVLHGLWAKTGFTLVLLEKNIVSDPWRMAGGQAVSWIHSFNKYLPGAPHVWGTGWPLSVGITC